MSPQFRGDSPRNRNPRLKATSIDNAQMLSERAHEDATAASNMLVSTRGNMTCSPSPAPARSHATQLDGPRPTATERLSPCLRHPALPCAVRRKTPAARSFWLRPRGDAGYV
jgi:hypothetical protein